MEHWCTLQNDIANDGGAASTGSKFSRTSAVNDLQRKKAGANRNCRATIFDATPHAVYLSVRPVLRFFYFKKKKDKQNQKLGKAHFHVEGRRSHSSSGLATNMNFPHVEEYVLLCEARGAAKANTSNRVVESGANKAWNAASHHA